VEKMAVVVTVVVAVVVMVEGELKAAASLTLKGSLPFPSW